MLTLDGGPPLRGGWDVTLGGPLDGVTVRPLVGVPLTGEALTEGVRR